MQEQAMSGVVIAAATALPELLRMPSPTAKRDELPPN